MVTIQALKPFTFRSHSFVASGQYTLTDEEGAELMDSVGPSYFTLVQDSSSAGGAAASNIDVDVGAPNDAAAGSDTGTFSLIALIKRGLQSATTHSGKLDTLNTSVGTVNTSVGTVNTSVGTINTNLGALADSAAGDDTGSHSLLAFVKRGMQNWTSLLAKIPTSIASRVPVVTLPKIGSAKQQAISGTSAAVQLTNGTTAISIVSRGCQSRYALGTVGVTANASTSHFIDSGERLEFSLDTSTQTYIAVIAISGTGTLEITELV